MTGREPLNAKRENDQKDRLETCWPCWWVSRDGRGHAQRGETRFAGGATHIDGRSQPRLRPPPALDWQSNSRDVDRDEEALHRRLWA